MRSIRGVPAACVCASVLLLASQSQAGKTNQNQDSLDNQPIYDLLPEPSDPAQLALRIARGRVYDTKGPSLLSAGSPSSMRVSVDIFDADGHGPPLPVRAADVVAVAEVEKAQAYLSTSRTEIYTELGLRVEAVLKSSGTHPVAAGDSIVASRLGGALRLPSGKVISARDTALGSLLIGARYVVFLRYDPAGQWFRLFNAWKIADGKPVPVDTDDADRCAHNRCPYTKMSEEQFEDTVRRAASAGSPSSGIFGQQCGPSGPGFAGGCGGGGGGGGGHGGGGGDPCSHPPTTTRKDAWSHGASVLVNIDPAFGEMTNQASLAAAIVAVFKNWQSCNGNTCSGGGAGNSSAVTFSFEEKAQSQQGPDIYQVSQSTLGYSQQGTAIQGETTDVQGSVNLSGATTDIDLRVTDGVAIAQVMAHEIGHTFGLADCTTCTAQSSVMTVLPVGDKNFNDTSTGLVMPTTCDDIAANSIGGYPVPGGGGGGNTACAGSPASCGPCGFNQMCQGGVWTCTNVCPPPATGCTGSEPFCGPDDCGDNCDATCYGDTWVCPTGTYCAGDAPNCPANSVAQCNGPGQWVCNFSPVIFDLAGQGIRLTDPSDGVRFDLTGNKQFAHTSWTERGSEEAWLVLDRNGNGVIDSAQELFGNLTPQPAGPHPNGFKALAVFDRPENGGNGNGFIDPGDAVYDHLRLWIDRNHDGISQPDELYTLREAGIFKIDLHYSESRRKDRHGNEYRYRAAVIRNGGQAADACYDVWLTVMPISRH